ncbi:MAG: hypothetical protein JKY37_31160 [Nannocystaceae bacterium]|nr:hypothetical protein [Nannocystaceae bacterium]
MGDSESCGMCEAPGRASGRNFGLDVCAVCEAGQLTGRLGSWGAEISSEVVMFTDRHQQTYDQIRVRASVQGVQPLLAVFSRPTTKSKIVGLFRKRFKAGDPLFDHAVAVQTQTPGFLRTLLQNDGFQSAIMTLTTHAERFEVTGGAIELAARVDALDLRAELPLAAAAVLRHIKRLG